MILEQMRINAESTGVIPAELAQLRPAIHFCPDWDDLLIDDTDPEWRACLCAVRRREPQLMTRPKA